MNIYRVVIKGNDPERKMSTWGDSVYLIAASSFGNAEDKVQKVIKSGIGKLHSIAYEGVANADKDIMTVNTR